MGYFTNIIGQNSVIRMLRKAIDDNMVSHAYLFTGGEGFGKMTTAIAFAKTIIANIDQSSEIYFQQGIHPDLLIVEIAKNKTVITKEQITNDVEQWLALKPYRAAHRIVIIRDGHLMSLEAANALLKTLEEPPDHSIIVVIADDSNLLETIVSRCQIVKFSPIKEEEIKDYLMQKGFEGEISSHSARLGQGSVAKALLFAEKTGELYKAFDQASMIVQELAKEEIIEVFNAAAELEKNPVLLISIIETILRNTYIYKKTGNKDLIIMPAETNIIRLLEKVNPEAIMNCLKQIDLLKGYYKRNVNSLIISTNICFKIREALK